MFIFACLIACYKCINMNYVFKTGMQHIRSGTKLGLSKFMKPAHWSTPMFASNVRLRVLLGNCFASIAIIIYTYLSDITEFCLHISPALPHRRNLKEKAYAAKTYERNSVLPYSSISVQCCQQKTIKSSSTASFRSTQVCLDKML